MQPIDVELGLKVVFAGREAWGASPGMRPTGDIRIAASQR